MSRIARTAVVVCAVSAVLMISAAVSTCQAAEMSFSGHSVWAPMKATSTMKLPDGRTVQRLYLKGFATVDHGTAPGDFHSVSQDCMFTAITSADGSSESSGGYCDGVDSDGDVFWVWGQADKSGGTWHYIGGTGKFMGIQGGGPYKLTIQFPDGKAFATWSGTWKK
jgi:hypothetical protein